MSSNVPDLSAIKEENLDFAVGEVYRREPFNVKPLPIGPSGLPSHRISTQEIEIEQTQRYAGLGLEITSSVIGSLISHPCIVLRRQCQVNKKANRYHLNPFTLIPIIIRIQNRQGLKTLWKGAGGTFILTGFAVALETAIAELTPFPREISMDTSIKNIVQHLLLKSLTFGILTPFYCSSLVETVQSDIASEKPGVLDCLKEGMRRLLRWGTPQSTRLLPIWQLIGPTVAYDLANYIISSLVRSIVLWIITLQLQSEGRKHGAIVKTSQKPGTKYLNNLFAIHLGHMVANVLLFPAETVLNRLYLQGTRTIIDNLDSGISVLAVITKYEGATDCFNTIVQEEGASGLYKGFGALILEYTLQAVVLKIAKTVFQEISVFFRPSKSEKVHM